MMTIAMIAIESTVVSTAMPQVVADLGGLQFYSWVFSSYLLAQTAMTVIFGNMADVYGRKPIMLAGIAIFLVGSLLAGFARSMPVMILCRLVQGVGAGAMQPVSMTIVGDLYPARERGKVQGYLASVWAVAAIAGPLLGGFIVRSLSWKWIFWINIPVGFITAAGFLAFLKEDPDRQGRSIDVGGAISFTVAIASLLIALTELGTQHATRVAAATASFAIAVAAFSAIERHAKYPMVSFTLWSQRAVATTNALAVMTNMSIIGLTTFLPIYVQLVMHRSPTTAGLALTTLLIGWPAGATAASRLFHRFTLRQLMITGALVQTLGASVFLMLEPTASVFLPAGGSLLMGFGVGLVTVPSIVLIQEIVDRTQRGSATASNVFSRNLGSTLGATLLGAVLNYGLRGSGHTGSVALDQIRQLLTTQDQPARDAPIRLALAHALSLTFRSMFVLMLGTIVLALLVPRTVGIVQKPQGDTRDEP